MKLLFGTLALFSILAFIYFDKDNASETQKIQNSTKETSVKTQRNSIENLNITSHQTTLSKNESGEKEKEEQASNTQTAYTNYLNHRKEMHINNQIMRNEYLSKQATLRMSRQGGVERQFSQKRVEDYQKYRQNYKYESQTKNHKQKQSFMKERTARTQQKDRIKSLQNTQILQTQYRGEL